MAADGRTNFVEAIKEFEAGDLDARLLEVLCCNGCIMGAGMTTDAPLFSRRVAVSQYVRAAARQGTDEAQWLPTWTRFADLDLARPFVAQRPAHPACRTRTRSAIMLARMGKSRRRTS